MDQNLSPAKSSMSLGFIFGVIMALQVVISYEVGLQALAETNFGLIINFLNYLILPILFIYLGCVKYKKQNLGFISFSQCLKVGVTTTFIAALVFGIFDILFKIIFPEYAAEILEFTRSEIMRKQPDLTSEKLEMQLSMARKFTQPLCVNTDQAHGRWDWRWIKPIRSSQLKSACRKICLMMSANHWSWS